MSLDVFEKLDLSRAKADLQLGHWSTGRGLLLKAMRAAGLSVGKRPSLDDAALEALPPHWLLLCGQSMQNGYALWAVPESLLDADARAWLDACDNAILNPDSDDERPDAYRAFRLVQACCGNDEWWRFGRFDDRQSDERRVGEAAYRALLGRWAACRVGLSSESSRAKLDAKITRVVHVFERL